jgi:hypothetical protein
MRINQNLAGMVNEPAVNRISEVLSSHYLAKLLSAWP